MACLSEVKRFACSASALAAPRSISYRITVRFKATCIAKLVMESQPSSTGSSRVAGFRASRAKSAVLVCLLWPVNDLQEGEPQPQLVVL